MHPYHDDAKKSEARIMARYKDGGGVAAKAVHAHERHDHKGEPLTDLSGMRKGGKVQGMAPKTRLDKYARGGKVKGPSKINIVIATGKPDQPQPVPVPVPRPVPVPVNAGHPPMPPPAMPAGMPPGMPAGMPPGGPMGGMPPRPPMKRGGTVKGQFALSDAGAAGGAGRLEKAEAYSGKDMDGGKLVKVRAHTRKTGGRV